MKIQTWMFLVTREKNEIILYLLIRACGYKTDIFYNAKISGNNVSTTHVRKMNVHHRNFVT